MTPMDSSVVAWALQHLHWPFIVYAGWKVSTWVTEFKSRATQVEDHVNNMAQNHFPHMEESLAKQDRYLESIDKNIGRMADKL